MTTHGFLRALSEQKLKVTKQNAVQPVSSSGFVVRKLVTLCCAAALVAGSLLSAQPALAEDPVQSIPAATAEAEGTDVSLQEEIGEHGAYMGQSLAAQQPNSPAGPGSEEQSVMGARSLTPLAGSWKAPGINGIDVSGWQPNVNWQQQWDMGARFAYVKSTEGDTFTSDTFSKQYTGAYNAGMIRGAYHFALPSPRNAVSQAKYFVNNGGGWSPDGKTLPPLLDIEHNPYESLGNMCYDMSPSQLVNWISDFSDTVKSMIGRTPMIYTSYAWWTHCTNNSTTFSGDHALHAAAYPYPGYEDGFNVYMFGGWKDYTVWQYSSTGPFAGDSNLWNGTSNELKQFATNGFADVNIDTAYYREITWADRQGVTTGWPDGTYRPFSEINRDAIAAFIYRLADEPGFTPPKKSPFKDYPYGSLFYKEITWLESTGISNGWSNGTYRPGEAINRDAMAAFLYRLAGEPDFNAPKKSPFKDYPYGSPFYTEVTWLESTGITTGWNDGTYRPLEPINRDAMAAFLYRFDKNL